MARITLSYICAVEWIYPTVNELRETILLDYSKTLPPTETAIAFIKNEVKKLLS